MVMYSINHVKFPHPVDIKIFVQFKQQTNSLILVSSRFNFRIGGNNSYFSCMPWLQIFVFYYNHFRTFKLQCQTPNPWLPCGPIEVYVREQYTFVHFETLTNVYLYHFNISLQFFHLNILLNFKVFNVILRYILFYIVAYNYFGKHRRVNHI